MSTNHAVPPANGSSHSFHLDMAARDFAWALYRVTDAPKAEGFGVLTDIGLLLPCNMVWRQKKDDRLTVGRMDPVAVMQTASDPEVIAIASEVRERLMRMRGAVGPRVDHIT